MIDVRTTGEMFGVDARDIEDDEPDAWPEPEQRKLDESVRCAICQELFTMPVSFSTCTHSCASPTRRVSTLEDRDCDHERHSHRPRVTLTGFRAYLSTRSLLVVHPTHAEGVQTRVPSLQSPGEGGGSETQSRARGCRRSVQAAGTRLLAGARRVDDPMPSSRRASRARGTTKRNKRGGANNDRAPAPDDAPPQNEPRVALRETPTRQRVMRLLRKRKRRPDRARGRRAVRRLPRRAAGVGASDSRFPRRAAAPTPPSEDDTADEEDEDDKGEAGDADYGGTQGDDEGDDVVSESDLETDAAARDDVVDLVDDEDGSGGGGKSRRKLGSRQPSAPSTTPGGSDDKKRPGTVQCPICGVGVQEGLINSHVDVCLTRGGAFGSAIAEAVGGESSPKDEFGNENSDEQYAMAKLPKLVYHIMKDKPLRKLLSDAGLSAVGRRDQLIDRHKEFTLRVNASIDSGHRPNLAAIAKEVSKLERDRDRAGMMPAPGLMGSGGSGLAAAAAGPLPRRMCSAHLGRPRSRQRRRESTKGFVPSGG